MINFQNFTTDYDGVEDRIRLSGRDAAGALATVWLNLRMANLLVPILVNWLETRAVPAGPAHADVQKFQQDAAISLQQAAPTPPVPPLPGTLAVSIDYHFLAQGIRLTFKDQAGAVMAVVDLPELVLRQWLTILYQQHLRAGWPVGAFPAWVMVDPAAPAVLH
ncbi:MAG: hypothetical protein WCO11_08250 [Sphingomonadales bacterium]|jgi:hypothetical protein